MNKFFHAVTAILLLALPGIAQDKVQLTDLEGIWITSNSQAFEFKIKKNSIKMFRENDGGGSSLIFSEKGYPVFEAATIKNGLLTTIAFPNTLIGTTFTVNSKNEITFKIKPNDSTVVAHKLTIDAQGNIFVKDSKIGKVIKTAGSNVMTTTIPEFEIYDVNDVPRFKFEGVAGKFMLLDDNKSYLPRMVDPYPYQIASFFAKDSILTKDGFNESYRSAFIKKYRGFDASAKQERNFDDEVTFVDGEIWQSGIPIGSTGAQVKPNGNAVRSDLGLYPIYGANKKLVAVIELTEGDEVKEMTKMIIRDANQKDIITFKDKTSGALYFREGVLWLVKNRFL